MGAGTSKPYDGGSMAYGQSGLYPNRPMAATSFEMVDPSIVQGITNYQRANMHVPDGTSNTNSFDSR